MCVNEVKFLCLLLLCETSLYTFFLRKTNTCWNKRQNIKTTTRDIFCLFIFTYYVRWMDAQMNERWFTTDYNSTVALVGFSISYFNFWWKIKFELNFGVALSTNRLRKERNLKKRISHFSVGYGSQFYKLKRMTKEENRWVWKRRRNVEKRWRFFTKLCVMEKVLILIMHHRPNLIRICSRFQ